MGTNYYLYVFAPSLAFMRNITSFSDDLIMLIYGYLKPRKLGPKSECYSINMYHIGKNSGGWKFIFNVQMLEYWKDMKNPKYNLVQFLVDAVTYRYFRSYDFARPPMIIESITEDDVFSILREPNVVIGDENECSISYESFKLTVKNSEFKNDNSEAWDSYSYNSRRSEKFTYGFKRQIQVDSLIFSNSVEFI